MKNKKKQQQKQRKQKEELEFQNKQKEIKEILHQNGINYHDLYNNEVVDELKQCLKDLKQISYIVDGSLIKQSDDFKNIHEIVSKVCSGGSLFIDAVKQLQKIPKQMYRLGEMIARMLEKILECDIAYQKVCNILYEEIKKKKSQQKISIEKKQKDNTIILSSQDQQPLTTQKDNKKYQELVKDIQKLKKILQYKNEPKQVVFSQTGKSLRLQDILIFKNNKSQSHKQDKDKKQKIKEGIQKVKKGFDKLKAEITNEKQKITQFLELKSEEINKRVLQYKQRIEHLENDLKQQKRRTDQDNQKQLKKLRQEKEKQRKQKELYIKQLNKQKSDHQKKILQLQDTIKLKDENMQKLKKSQKQSTSLEINQEFSQQILLGPQFALWSPLLLGYEVSKYERPKKVYKEQRGYLLKTLQDYTKKKVKRTKILYSYDNIVQTNFHLYVDNIPNYVVILKLKNGNLIAAYSENALASVGGNKGPGFIASLKNKITTFIDSTIEGARTTNYNQYYMIFGNDEFRFQPQKREVTCLVGYQFSFYRPKIRPIDLLGVESETSEFINYEVHKVIFDNEE